MRTAQSSETDLQDVLLVQRLAFGHDQDAELVRDLLNDPSAQPLLSLLAREDDRPVGHVLFTAARLDDLPDAASIAILAPLAVVPDAQRRGVGSRLIALGLQILSERGVDLVFVLGHPDYYPPAPWVRARRPSRLRGAFPDSRRGRGHLDGSGSSPRCNRRSSRNGYLSRRTRQAGALAGVAGGLPGGSTRI